MASKWDFCWECFSSNVVAFLKFVIGDAVSCPCLAPDGNNKQGTQKPPSHFAEYTSQEFFFSQSSWNFLFRPSASAWTGNLKEGPGMKGCTIKSIFPLSLRDDGCFSQQTSAQSNPSPILFGTTGALSAAAGVPEANAALADDGTSTAWGSSSTVMTGGQAVLSKLSALKLDVGVSAHSPSSSTSFRFFVNKSLIVGWADAFRFFDMSLWHSKSHWRSYSNQGEYDRR